MFHISATCYLDDYTMDKLLPGHPDLMQFLALGEGCAATWDWLLYTLFHHGPMGIPEGLEVIAVCMVLKVVYNLFAFRAWSWVQCVIHFTVLPVLACLLLRLASGGPYGLFFAFWMWCDVVVAIAGAVYDTSHPHNDIEEKAARRQSIPEPEFTALPPDGGREDDVRAATGAGVSETDSEGEEMDDQIDIRLFTDRIGVPQNLSREEMNALPSSIESVPFPYSHLPRAREKKTSTMRESGDRMEVTDTEEELSFDNPRRKNAVG